MERFSCLLVATALLGAGCATGIAGPPNRDVPIADDVTTEEDAGEDARLEDEDTWVGLDAGLDAGPLDAPPVADDGRLHDAPSRQDAPGALDALSATDGFSAPDAAPDAYSAPDAYVVPDAYALPDAYASPDAYSPPCITLPTSGSRTWTGTTVGGPSFARPSEPFDECPADGVAGSRPYQAVTFCGRSGRPSYEVEIGGSTSDSYMVAYNGIGIPTDTRACVAIDDDDGAGANGYLVLTVGTGPFTIVVTGYGASDVGSFSLTATPY